MGTKSLQETRKLADREKIFEKLNEIIQFYVGNEYFRILS